MASISNTGKTMTVAFSVAEKEQLAARGGDDWKWQVPEFSIDDNGVGRLTLRADMHNGRKLGLISSTPEERWMLVIPSAAMPLAPYFKKVAVEADFTSEDGKVTVFKLPRELPAITDRQMKALAGTPKPKVRKAQVAPTPAPMEAAPAPVPTPQQRNGSNITMLIEGKSFRFEVPIEKRLRMMSELAEYAVTA